MEIVKEIQLTTQLSVAEISKKKQKERNRGEIIYCKSPETPLQARGPYGRHPTPRKEWDVALGDSYLY